MEGISDLFNIQERRHNYRGISVNGTLRRLFSKILQKDCIEKLDENQSGFIPGRSCVNNYH